MMKLMWEEDLIYLDNHIVLALTFKIFLERLKHVFQRLMLADLKLKPCECFFGFNTIKYLGDVSTNGIQPDPDKVQAMNGVFSYHI